jgi:hypothetical protein
MAAVLSPISVPKAKNSGTPNANSIPAVALKFGYVKEFSGKDFDLLTKRNGWSVLYQHGDGFWLLKNKARTVAAGRGPEQLLNHLRGT